MNPKPILKAALVCSILLMASGAVGACAGCAKAGDPAPAARASTGELDTRQHAIRGIVDDDLLGPTVVIVRIDRTDVPWQASGVGDPDKIRSF